MEIYPLSPFLLTPNSTFFTPCLKMIQKENSLQEVSPMQPVMIQFSASERWKMIIKNNSLIKFLHLRTIPGMAYTPIIQYAQVLVKIKVWDLKKKRNNFSPFIFVEKLHNQTSVTPEVEKRENHMKNNERNPSQYLIHFIKSSLRLFAGLSMVHVD